MVKVHVEKAKLSPNKYATEVVVALRWEGEDCEHDRLGIIKPSGEAPEVVQIPCKCSVCHTRKRLTVIRKSGRGEKWGPKPKDTICSTEGCPGIMLTTIPEVSRGYWPVPVVELDKEDNVKVPAAKEVYDEVEDFIRKHFVHDDERVYGKLALWVMHTYCVDFFETVPYVQFLASHGSGKTRGLEVLCALSYRGMLTAGFTPANLYRLIDKYHPTLLLDESGHSIHAGSEAGKTIISVLNQGYKRGSLVFRTNLQKGEDPIGFDCFGPKAIAAVKGFLSTLESRCIIIPMIKGKPENRTMDEDWAALLRGKLTVWAIYAPVEPVWPDAEDGRVEEVFVPLYSIAHLVGDDAVSSLEKFMKSEILRRKHDEKMSDEALVVQALVEQLGPSQRTEKIRIKEVCDAYNEMASEDHGEDFRDCSYRKMAYKLKALGLSNRARPARDNHGAYLPYDKNLARIKGLAKKYHVSLSGTPLGKDE